MTESQTTSTASQRRRERERQARAEAILDAAEPIVLRTGYRGLRMDEVAEAAEVSKGTLYLYFANKDALCAGVAARHMARSQPELLAVMDSAPTGIEAVAISFDTHMRDFTENPALFRFMTSWLLPGTPLETDSPAFARYREHIGTAFQHVFRALERGHQDGTIRRDGRVEVLAVQIWTSFIGAMFAKLGDEGLAPRMPFRVDFDAVVSQQRASLLAGIAAPQENA